MKQGRCFKNAVILKNILNKTKPPIYAIGGFVNSPFMKRQYSLFQNPGNPTLKLLHDDHLL